LGASLKTAFFHSNPKLQFAWNCAQIGILIFPLSPALGAVGLIVASVVTWLQQYRAIILRPLTQGFALLSLLFIISAAFAYDKTAAFLGLFNLLPFLLGFAAFTTLIQTTAQLRQISWILSVTSFPVVVMGLGQMFLGWNLHFQFLWIVLDWTIAPGGNPLGRMSSNFMYANTLAGYLVIVFILNLGLWLETYQQFRKQADRGTQVQGNFTPLPLLFLTVTVIGNFLALILTDSRNAWAIAIAACLAYALLLGWHLLVAGVASLTTGVILAAFAPSPIAELFRRIVPAFFWARLNDQMYPDRPIALMRKTQWEFAWSMAMQRPLTGWGLRNFTPLYQEKMHIWLGHPHNFFLMLSGETGLPATLLFCGLLLWILVTGVKILLHFELAQKEDKLTFFSYLVVFVGWILFNTADVTLFDVRLNLLSWLLLFAIAGVVYHYKKLLANNN
jgi:O-antigen ligase